MKDDLNSAFDSHGVMGRMEWFRDMRALFLEVSDGRSDIVSKQELVRGLSAKGPELDLQEASEFRSQNTVVHYSFEQVVSQLSKAKEDTLTWDQVIDYLIQLGLNRKSGSSSRTYPKKLELPNHDESPKKLVSMKTDRSPSSASKATLQRFASEKNLKTTVLPLHEYFSKKPTPVPNSLNSVDLSSSGLTGLPRTANFSSLMFLSLAGNSLHHTRFEWPPLLVCLNLSSNGLTEIDLAGSLSKLQLLNISHNLLKRIPPIPSCKNLNELYASHNDLSQIGNLCKLSQLTVLDLSYNSLNCLEELATLAPLMHLQVIKVKENGLARDYASTLKVVLPRVSVIDPVDIAKHSKFQSAKHLVLTEVKAETPSNKVRRSFTKPFLKKYLSDSKLKEVRIEIPNKPRSVRGKGSPIQSRASSVLSETASSRTVSHTQQEAKTPSTAAIAVHNEESSMRPVYLEDYQPAMMFVEELDRRLRTSHGKLETFSAAALNKSVSLVTQQAIQQAQTKTYGNPIAALMIGPPASRGKSSRAIKPPSKPSMGKSFTKPHRPSDTRQMRRTFDSCN